MRILLTKEEMKNCDRVTMEEFGMPSLVLMERAALACVDELYQSGASLEKVLVVCGSGNNGGDGLAIARLLLLDGVNVSVFFAGREASCTHQTAAQKRVCEKYGVTFCSNPKMREYTVIVDALFGVGLSRDIAGDYVRRIAEINESPAFVLSVDIPSGIDGDTGCVRGIAVRADLTVTFAFEQPGHYIGKGRAYTGKLKLRRIGITKESLQGRKPVFHCYDETDFSRLPLRLATENKGSCGKVLLIAGSSEMCGAVILSAKAAYRSGAGLVRVFTDACNKPVILQAIPEAIVDVPEAVPGCQLEKLLDWADAVAIGPGTGMGAEKLEILRYVLKYAKKPLILDADALNLAAAYKLPLSGYKNGLTVTPHPGEMARLCQKPISEITGDLPYFAGDFALKNHLTCVLKDAGTVVSNGREQYINVSGNSGMATGGSGDVLTGILAGLTAQGMAPFDAARLGVYLHGCAGDAAARKTGKRSLLAGDIADSIGDILGGLEKKYEQ